MRVGILALQGDFAAHRAVLSALGATAVEVRTAAELGSVEGIVLPGGESTTMLKLIEEDGLREPLVEFARQKPLLGTCAGAILMAERTLAPDQRGLGLLDMDVERNAYGRQLDSSIRRLRPEDEFIRRSEPGELEAVFIRAPIIRRVGDGVTVLARDGDDPILVEEGSRLAATFHPELTSDRRVHSLFLEKIRELS